jgi:hypothetical protein
MSKRDDETLDRKWQSMDAQMSSLQTNTTLCDITSVGSAESTQSVHAPLKPPSPQLPLPVTCPTDDNDDEKQMDMWFFLFGFLCFPLWWISAWRFFTPQKGKKNTRTRVFQIINVWMTMASLVLLGLMVGLTVTFAS